jgi:hypothetical protein
LASRQNTLEPSTLDSFLEMRQTYIGRNSYWEAREKTDGEIVTVTGV